MLGTIVLIGAITAALGRLLGDVGTIGNLLVAVISTVAGLYLLDGMQLNWNGASLLLSPALRGWAGEML